MNYHTHNLARAICWFMRGMASPCEYGLLENACLIRLRSYAGSSTWIVTPKGLSFFQSLPSREVANV